MDLVEKLMSIMASDCPCSCRWNLKSLTTRDVIYAAPFPGMMILYVLFISVRISLRLHRVSADAVQRKSVFVMMTKIYSKEIC